MKSLSSLSLFSGLFLLLVFCIPFPGFAAGADKIFEEIGHEKPAGWGRWEREQKHEYFQGLGLSPSANGKYAGKAGDLTEYFAKQGLVQPENWSEMTFTEKKEYMASVTIPTPKEPEKPISLPDQTPTPSVPEQTNELLEIDQNTMPSFLLFLIGAFGVFSIILLLFLMFRKK